MGNSNLKLLKLFSLFFIIFLFFFLVFFKTYKILRPKYSYEKYNIVVLKEKGKVYGEVSFKNGKFVFKKPSSNIEGDLKLDKPIKIGEHSYRLIVLPKKNNYFTFFNRDFDDVITGKNLFYIGNDTYMNNDDKRKKNFLIILSKEQIKDIFNRNVPRDFNGILAKVIPYEPNMPAHRNTPGSFTAKTLKFKIIPQEKYGDLLKDVIFVENPETHLKSEDNVIENNSLVHFGRYILKFNIERKTVPIIKNKNEGNDKSPKEFVQTAKTSTFLKVSIRQNRLNENEQENSQTGSGEKRQNNLQEKSNGREIYEAYLQSDDGVTFALDLTKPNKLIGEKELLSIVSGHVIPPYVDNFKEVKEKLNIISALKNNKVVSFDRSKGEFVFNKDKLDDMKTLSPVKKRLISMVLKKQIDSLNRQLKPFGFALNLNIILKENSVRVKDLDAGTDKSWSVYLANKKGEGNNITFEIIPDTKSKVQEYFFNNAVLKDFAGTPFIKPLPFFARNEGDYLCFEKKFTLPRNFLVKKFKIFSFQNCILMVNNRKIDIKRLAVSNVSLRLRQGENTIRVYMQNKVDSVPLFLDKPVIKLKIEGQGIGQSITQDDLKKIKVYYSAGFLKNWKANNATEKWSQIDASLKGNEISFPLDDYLNLKKTGVFTRYFKILIPQELDNKNLNFSVTNNFPGKMEVYFSGVKQKANSFNKQNVSMGDWLAIKADFYNYGFQNMLNSSILVKQILSENDSDKKRKVRNLKLKKFKNPFLEKSDNFSGEIVDRDEKNSPYFIIVDGENSEVIGKKLILSDEKTYLVLTNVKNSAKIKRNYRIGFAWKPGNITNNKKQKNEFLYKITYNLRNSRLQVHNPHKGTKIYHFRKPHLEKTRNTLKAVLKPYKLDNGNRILSFEDKIVYGNNYFIYQDSIPSNLFGQVFFLPNFYSLVFNSGDISFDQGIQSILFEKKGGKIILKTDSQTLPSILLNGDKLLTNNSQQVRKELESGDVVNINGIKMLFVNNNSGVLCAINVKNGSKKVSYPSGCVDFATFGGLPQIKGSLYYIFRNFFAKNKKAKVKLTIDNDLQQLILSECEKEINYIKSRDYLTLRSGALTKNKRKMLLKKDYSCSFILMTQDNEILADVSYPYVNVLKDNSDLKKVFAIDQVSYRQSPLINRVTQLTYPPGSSFKIVSTMAFLENSRRKYIGSLIGHFPILGVSDLHNQRLKNGKRIYFHLKNFKNEKISGKTKNLKYAFTQSYNIYYAYIAMHLSKTIMEKSLIFKSKIGFAKLGYASSKDRKEDFPFLKYVDLLHINKGYNLFPIENKKAIELGIRRWEISENRGVDKLFAIPSVFQVNAYLPDEIAMAAIGQRIVQLTPLQNAVDASVIANNGKLYNPMLVKELRYDDKKYSIKNKSENLNLKKYTVNRIKYFMKQVPKEGTAVGTFSDFVFKGKVWCKTGTAEHNGGDDHSWLVGFYKDPISDKIFIFAACFPNSGEGSRIAGQCVKRVLDRLFLVSKNIVWNNNSGK